MTIIPFGYDKPANYERGFVRADGKFKAVEDPRGFGWQIVECRYLNRNPRHMTKEEALALLISL